LVFAMFFGIYLPTLRREEYRKKKRETEYF
jgi:hypothetical protein